MESMDSVSRRIDLNRAGRAVLELVTDPCIHSAQQAVACLRWLHRLLVYHDIVSPRIEEVTNQTWFTVGNVAMRCQCVCGSSRNPVS